MGSSPDTCNTSTGRVLARSDYSISRGSPQSWRCKWTPTPAVRPLVRVAEAVRSCTARRGPRTPRPPNTEYGLRPAHAMRCARRNTTGTHMHHGTARVICATPNTRNISVTQTRRGYNTHVATKLTRPGVIGAVCLARSSQPDRQRNAAWRHQARHAHPPVAEMHKRRSHERGSHLGRGTPPPRPWGHGGTGLRFRARRRRRCPRRPHRCARVRPAVGTRHASD